MGKIGVGLAFLDVAAVALVATKRVRKRREYIHVGSGGDVLSPTVSNALGGDQCHFRAVGNASPTPIFPTILRWLKK